MKYDSFIQSKSDAFDAVGIDVGYSELHPSLFPHQKDLVKWALRKGRAAIFADTGLGKTRMELEWARHVSKNGRVLILTPLAVAHQFIPEAAELGLECQYLREDDPDVSVVVTNYEMLEKFNPDSFSGVIIDESSILKAFDGKTRNLIITSFANVPMRLAATATPAPNDHGELGNHSEFLGIKSRVEMLAEYFVHDGETTQEWRLKGHAKDRFWLWVASWGAVVQKPSDLGHDDGGYSLPPLDMHEHVIPISHEYALNQGALFAMEVKTLSEQRTNRRDTMADRVSRIAELVGSNGRPWVIWCELNDESDMLAKSIDGSVQLRGSDSHDEKGEKLIDFASGKIRVLITKSSITGFGLNWQHCSDTVFMGASHSFEQTYQAVRRFWRFGQKRKVNVHVLRAENESAIMANYRRKEADAARMAEEMRQHVKHIVMAEVAGASKREWNPYEPLLEMVVPPWILEDSQ